MIEVEAVMWGGEAGEEGALYRRGSALVRGKCRPAAAALRLFSSPKNWAKNRTTVGVIEMLQTGTHFKPRVERRHLNLAPFLQQLQRVRLSGDDDDVHERGAHTRATVQHACTHARRGVYSSGLHRRRDARARGACICSPTVYLEIRDHIHRHGPSAPPPPPRGSDEVRLKPAAKRQAGKAK
jgi:hypothetical protein